MSHCQLMQGDKMMFDCWAQLTFSIKSIKETFFSHLLILSTWLTLHPHTLESMATMDTGEIFTLSWIDTDRILIANDWAAGSQNNIFESFANLVNTSKIEPIHYGASSVINWKLLIKGIDQNDHFRHVFFKCKFHEWKSQKIWSYSYQKSKRKIVAFIWHTLDSS